MPTLMKPRSLCFHITLFIITVFLSGKSFANVGIVIHDTLGGLRPLFQGGHAGLYISSACIDKTKNKPSVRICGSSDSAKGVVLGRYMKLSEYEKLDFVPVSFSGYFYGSKDIQSRPYFGNHKIIKELFNRTYTSELSHFVSRKEGEAAGRWSKAIGAALLRNSYIYEVETTLEEDAMIVEAINNYEHSGKFNTLTSNCSHFVREVLNMLFFGFVDQVSEVDLVTSTPKGVGLALEAVASKNNRKFIITKIPQLPGMHLKSGPISNGPEMLSEAGIMLGSVLLLGPVGILPASIALIATNTFDPDEKYSNNNYQNLISAKRELQDTRMALQRAKILKSHMLINVATDQVALLEVVEHDQNVRVNDIEHSIFGSLHDWKYVTNYIEALLKELADKKVFPSNILNLASSPSKGLMRYLEKVGHYYINENNTVSISLDGETVELTEEGLRTSKSKLGLLVVLAKLQYQRALTSKLSLRHRPIIGEVYESLDLLRSISVGVLSENGNECSLDDLFCLSLSK